MHQLALGEGMCSLRDSCRFQVHRKRRMIRAHQGAAMVEFAVCLPMAVFLLLSTLEITRSIQLQHTLQLAVYEGARTAILPGATGPEIVAACHDVLDARDCAPATVTLTPSDPQAADVGDFIRVEVSIPAGHNALFTQRFLLGKQVTARAEAMKEY